MTQEVNGAAKRPQVNRELLLKVREKILAEPAQFEMELLFRAQEQFDMWEQWRRETPGCYPLDVYREVPNCGTAACIAGWAISIHLGENPDKANQTYSRLNLDAPKLLGLERPGGVALNGCGCFNCEAAGPDRFAALCYVKGWPEQHRAAWHATEDLEKRAKLAAEVIDLRLAQWEAEDKAQSAEEGK